MPWGHYGAAMFVSMDWNKAQGIKAFIMSIRKTAYSFCHRLVRIFVRWRLVCVQKHGYRQLPTLAFKRPAATAQTTSHHAPLSGKPPASSPLPVELLKIKRSPHLDCVHCPAADLAFIGTGNYLNNEIANKHMAFTLDTAHCFLLLFMPPLVGVYKLLVADLEHNGTNWNMVLTTTPV